MLADAKEKSRLARLARVAAPIAPMVDTAAVRKQQAFGLASVLGGGSMKGRFVEVTAKAVSDVGAGLARKRSTAAAGGGGGSGGSAATADKEQSENPRWSLSPTIARDTGSTAPDATSVFGPVCGAAFVSLDDATQEVLGKLLRQASPNPKTGYKGIETVKHVKAFLEKLTKKLVDGGVSADNAKTLGLFMQVLMASLFLHCPS